MGVAEIFETMTYGPAPETRTAALEWIARQPSPLPLYIDGAWTAAASNDTFATVNPATGEMLAQVSQAGQADVDAAVRAAQAALPRWRSLPGHARARHLYALARQVQKHARLLAVLEALDNGKPIRETRDLDIPLVARHFAWHAGWAQLMESELPGQGPVGVVGQIIPWNFPLLMLAWKIAPALAMGNTVVLKPAEYTPLTALAFAELATAAGLPPGVLNIVTGDGRAGALLVAHSDVDKIAFTGSTEVGRLIRQQTAGSGKKLSLELGGKSPFIVFDDADLDSAIEGIVDAIWFNQGQVCCAGSRLLVQENIADRLLARLRTRMERLRMGDPLDKAIDMGAIVAPVQLHRIQHLVEQGVAEGATLWQPSWDCPPNGCFYPPTLLTGVAPAATVAQVEIFGPVLVSMTFRSPAEAVALANNTRYGLAASIWSENINLALDVARRVKAGTVWINSVSLFDAASGFGGFRESGFGREGGLEGLWDYVRPLWMNQPAVVSSPAPPQTSDQSAEPEPDEHSLPPIDRTAKMFIRGRQVRPDSGYSRAVQGAHGRLLAEVGEGNRKDIRNAVEAAQAAAAAWAGVTAYNRAQILYYIAENLSARQDEFARRLVAMTGCAAWQAAREVECSLSRLFSSGAWADKYDGQVHHTPLRNVTLAMPEPLGVLGVVCPTTPPLLGLISLIAPAIAQGNAVVVVPSERYPLSATDLYQVLDTSDVPPGVVNIVTGERDSLARTLAEHDEVDGLWYFGTPDGVRMVEHAAAGNMKRTWAEVAPGRRDWADRTQGEGREFLRAATQVKNIWVPYGD